MKKKIIGLTLISLAFCSVSFAEFRRADSDLSLGAYSLVGTERSTNAVTPASDEISLYAKDNGYGTTAYYTKDSAGTVMKLLTLDSAVVGATGTYVTSSGSTATVTNGVIVSVT